jgi:hypothetical protein
MRITAHRLGWIVGMLIVSASAFGADHSILGRSLVVRSNGPEVTRTVVLVGREAASDVSTLSDPTAVGATLRMEVAGGTPATQVFSLPAAGWSAIRSGFRYRTEIGASAPVSTVVLKRKPSGVALIRVKFSGSVGSNDLQIAPPAPGDSGGIELEVTGGDRYCVGFGDGAGGKETSDTATLWRVVKATSEAACSPPPTPTPVAPPTPTSGGSGVCCGCGCAAPYYLHCPGSQHQCSVPAPGATDPSDCDAYDISGELDCEFFVPCDGESGGISFPYCTGLGG